MPSIIVPGTILYYRLSRRETGRFNNQQYTGSWIKVRYHNRQYLANLYYIIFLLLLYLCVNQIRKWKSKQSAIILWPQIAYFVLSSGSRNRKHLMKSNAWEVEKVSYSILSDISCSQEFYIYSSTPDKHEISQIYICT